MEEKKADGGSEKMSTSEKDEGKTTVAGVNAKDGIPAKGEPGRAKTIFTIAFIYVFIATLGVYFAQSMVNYNFGNFVKTTFGVSAAVMGMVTSCYSIVSILMRFISGPMMDSFPKKRVLMLGCGVYVCSALIYSQAPSLEIVIAGRLLQGVAMACCTASCMALAADILPGGKMGTGLGTLMTTQAICSAFAATIGLWIADKMGGYTWTYLCGALLFALAFILTLLVKEPKRERPKFKITPKRIIAPECWPAMLMLFLIQVCYYNSTTYMITYATEVNASLSVTIGLYFTVESLIVFFARPLYGKLSDKFGTFKIIVPSICCFIASFWIVSVATEMWQFLVAAAFAGFGYNPCKTLFQTLSIKFAGGKERRGVATSSSFLMQDLGNLIGAPLAGVIVGLVSFSGMWRIMTVFPVCALVLAVVMRKRIAEADERAKTQ